MRAREPGIAGADGERGTLHCEAGDPNAASRRARLGPEDGEPAGHGGLAFAWISLDPGFGAYEVSASASSSRCSPLMVMRRGLRCSGLGIRTSSTPSVNCAAIASGSTPFGSVSERLKAPNARSTR